LDATSGSELATFAGKITIGNSSATAVAGQMRFDGSGNLEFYNGTSWVRLNVSIEAGSTNFLSFNTATGELSVSNLLITDVTVNSSDNTMAAFVTGNYTGTEFQEGDVIILTLPNPTETWIHNGGIAGDITDFTQISTNIDDAYVRGLISATSPIAYNNTTGVISVATGFNIPEEGTATNQTLYWSGSQWTETSSVLINPTPSNELVTLTGKLQVGNSSATNAAGQIRWDGTNFQGYNGTTWINFDESGVPDGTATGQFLYWNGTDWVTTVNTTFDDDYSSVDFGAFINANGLVLVTPNAGMSIIDATGDITFNSSTGNIALQGGASTIITTGTNQDIVLAPNGNGSLIVEGSGNIIGSNGLGLIANSNDITIGSNTGNIILDGTANIIRTLANQDIVLSPSGNGSLIVEGSGDIIGNTNNGLNLVTTSNDININPGSGLTIFSNSKIEIGDSSAPDVAGQIRWNGTNFQGYNGSTWVDLDVQSIVQSGNSNDETLRWNGTEWEPTPNLLVSTTAITVATAINYIVDWVEVSGATTITNAHYVLLDATAAPYTVTLPASPTDGQIISFKDSGNASPSDVVTISAGANTIEGDTTVSINVPYEQIKLMWSSTAGEWLTVL
jgi:hypothetical protein